MWHERSYVRNGEGDEVEIKRREVKKEKDKRYIRDLKRGRGGSERRG